MNFDPQALGTALAALNPKTRPAVQMIQNLRQRREDQAMRERYMALAEGREARSLADWDRQNQAREFLGGFLPRLHDGTPRGPMEYMDLLNGVSPENAAAAIDAITKFKGQQRLDATNTYNVLKSFGGDVTEGDQSYDLLKSFGLLPEGIRSDEGMQDFVPGPLTNAGYESMGVTPPEAGTQVKTAPEKYHFPDDEDKQRKRIRGEVEKQKALLPGQLDAAGKRARIAAKATTEEMANRRDMGLVSDPNAPKPVDPTLTATRAASLADKLEKKEAADLYDAVVAGEYTPSVKEFVRLLRAYPKNAQQVAGTVATMIGADDGFLWMDKEYDVDDPQDLAELIQKLNKAQAGIQPQQGVQAITPPPGFVLDK